MKNEAQDALSPPREILTVAEMTAADREAIARGASGLELMERAGAAVVEAITVRFRPRPAVVLAGPGNNGGDGYVVARRLAELGWTVRVEALAAPKTPDAIAARALWPGDLQPLSQRLAPDELVIDALFGAGLDRPLPQEVVRLARQAQRSAERVVAVDTPSGLSGDTGRALGDACFRAALTVTFHRRKPISRLSAADASPPQLISSPTNKYGGRACEAPSNPAQPASDPPSNKAKSEAPPCASSPSLESSYPYSR